MRYAKEKISEIKKLRRRGCSISQIMSELSLPKTTVWHHVKDIVLTESQSRIIMFNKGGTNKRKELNIQKADIQAKELLSGKFREFIVIIAMLYWAEGRKADRCEFINSDGQMISIFLKIIRDVLNVPEKYLQFTVRIFTGMNEKECVLYWKKITNAKSKQIKVRLNDGGTSGRTKYGMCRITVRKSHQLLKLMHSLIKLISQEIITPL